MKYISLFVISSVILLVTLGPGMSKNDKQTYAQNSKNISQNKKHYLTKSHYPSYYHDQTHPKSPKWHPTNPHTGNFAD